MKKQSLFALLLLATSAFGGTPLPPSQICVDEVCESSFAAPQSTKWNPGHYVLYNLGDSQTRRFTLFEEDLKGNPSLAGAQVRYYWASLEPSKGNYDFSVIEADLEKLQSLGKRLWIQVMDRKFNTSSTSGIVPSYLLSSEFGGGLVQNATGYTSRLWDQKVMDRKIALMQALADRFDAEPYVEAITGAETAMGLSSPFPSGYSPTSFTTQLKREITAMSVAFRQTNVFVYTNFISGGSDSVMIDLIKHIHAAGLGAGGPDTFPSPRDGTQGDRIFSGSVGSIDYRGRMPIGQSVQSPELGGKEGNWTPAELLDEGVDDLGATHMSWQRKTESPGTTWSDIKEYLRNNPRINGKCPESYAESCAP